MSMNSDKTKITDLLLDLDFSKTEALTYEALLDLETVSIRKVAERSGINRGTTYEAIKKLVNVGLVSARQSGQREYYTAESPEKVYEIIKDKRKELYRVLETSKQVVPELLAEKARPQGRPLVRFYEHDEGIVTILKDVLRTCRTMDKPEYYAYSSRPIRQYLYRKFPQFTDLRIADDITVRVIAIGAGGEKAAASDRKWLPEPEDGSISSYTLIYGDKVAVISLAQDHTPYGVVIEDAGAASMHRLLFEQLWKSLK